MSKRTANVILSVLTLLLGGLIYLLLRETSIIAVALMHFPGIQPLQSCVSSFHFYFLEYYFVDYLWGLSLCSGLVSIHTPRKKGLIICAAATLVCGSLWEVLQYVGVVTGTGDWMDAIMYLLAAVTSLIFNYKERNE